ncbi:MAG: nuclear transport factor 2 family protein [Anaerolineales bacterium]
MTRSTQEVFDSHREAIETGDFEKLAGDYAEDAILVTLDGTYTGREAILRDFFQSQMGQFTDLTINFENTAVEDDMCVLQWSATAKEGSVPHGVGVFVIQDGLIQRQGEWFQLQLNQAD